MGAECFSAEKEQIDVLTAPDMGNASVGNVKSENCGRRTYVAFRFFIALKKF